MSPICCGCCKEMKCAKNGVIIKINERHFYSGDKFTCKQCNRSVITNLGTPFTVRPLDSTIEVIELEQ